MKPEESYTRLAAEFKRYPLLSREKETKLTRRWLKRRDEKARTAILNSNLMNVWILAYRYRHCGQQFEDLVSEGSIALMRAFDHYDPDLGIRFWSYANRAVSRQMLDHVRKFQSIAARPIDSVLGEGDVPLKHGSDEGGFEPRDAAPSPEQVQIDKDAASHVRDLVYKAMRKLSTRQFIVTVQRLLSDEPRLLHDVGATLGISKQAVNQNEMASLEILRRELSRHGTELAEVM